MAFALILLGLILGGILTIVTIIFAIISLANGKSKNALMWGVGFAISLTIVLVSIFQMVTRVTDKVKSGIDWVKEQENSQHINNDETKKAERQE
jgi:predicted tellurium resistance membrane protein TerC